MSTTNHAAALQALLQRARVLPVVTLEDATHAADVASALARGGLTAIEITLRTAAATAVIEAIARHVPQITVGAGTVLTPDDAARAARAGAQFLVSPGASDALYAAPRMLPWLPGIATASELMRGLDAGLRVFKFFPASAAGGTAALAALHAAFGGASFCPTGGITPHTAPQYLATPGVLCIGGSWLTPRDAIEARDWGRIEQLARAAAALGRDPR